MIGSSDLDRVQAVLVVDDEEGIRSYVRRVLEATKYEVMDAAGIREANRISGLSLPIDFMIIDVDLKGEQNGVLLAEWVARMRPNTHIILTSGSALPVQAFQPGAPWEFLPKPFTSGQLLDALGGSLLSIPSPEGRGCEHGSAVGASVQRVKRVLVKGVKDG